MCKHGGEVHIPHQTSITFLRKGNEQMSLSTKTLIPASTNVFKGEWDLAKGYDKDDIVIYSDNFFIANETVAANTPFALGVDGVVDTWRKLAASSAISGSSIISPTFGSNLTAGDFIYLDNAGQAIGVVDADSYALARADDTNNQIAAHYSLSTINRTYEPVVVQVSPNTVIIFMPHSSTAGRMDYYVSSLNPDGSFAWDGAWVQITMGTSGLTNIASGYYLHTYKKIFIANINNLYAFDYDETTKTLSNVKTLYISPIGGIGRAHLVVPVDGQCAFYHMTTGSDPNYAQGYYLEIDETTNNMTKTNKYLQYTGIMRSGISASYLNFKTVKVAAGRNIYLSYVNFFGSPGGYYTSGLMLAEFDPTTKTWTNGPIKSIDVAGKYIGSACCASIVEANTMAVVYSTVDSLAGSGANDIDKCATAILDIDLDNLTMDWRANSKEVYTPTTVAGASSTAKPRCDFISPQLDYNGANCILGIVYEDAKWTNPGGDFIQAGNGYKATIEAGKVKFTLSIPYTVVRLMNCFTYANGGTDDSKNFKTIYGNWSTSMYDNTQTYMGGNDWAFIGATNVATVTRRLEDYIGVAITTASAGSSGDVVLQGAVADCFAGLVPNKRYYIDYASGNLIEETFANTGDVLVGRAVSSTAILLDIDSNPTPLP